MWCTLCNFLSFISYQKWRLLLIFLDAHTYNSTKISLAFYWTFGSEVWTAQPHLWSLRPFVFQYAPSIQISFWQLLFEYTCIENCLIFYMLHVTHCTHTHTFSCSGSRLLYFPQPHPPCVRPLAGSPTKQTTCCSMWSTRGPFQPWPFPKCRVPIRGLL